MQVGGVNMTILALWLIRFYQRFLSPHKGFHCAHSAFFGGNSCSGAIYNLIQEQGLWRALPQIQIRFGECRFAYETLVRTGRIAGRDKTKKVRKKRDRSEENQGPRRSWQERRQERRRQQGRTNQVCLPLGTEYALCCEGAGAVGDGLECCGGIGEALEGCGSVGSCS
jgi:uncharacterized protein